MAPAPPATILLVDDDQLIRWSLRERLTQDGYRVVEAESGREAVQRATDDIDLVLLDVKLPDADGLSVMKEIRRGAPDLPIILVTALSSVHTAVDAIKQGAFHYVTKPFDLDEVAHLAAKALETTHLRRELATLRAREAQPYHFDSLLGRAPVMAKMRQLLAKVAQSPASTVLVTGESGSGKDLAAKIIHYNSARVGSPFMNITCSALPEALLESELFGHERGAFTDARQQKRGLFESAHGGTVFLDEIGEMAPGLQAKLLRFLEEKAFRRVGGTADVHVDVRVIAATNQNLEQTVKAGTFREDLFYRLNVLRVQMPALREHAADVPLLVHALVDTFSREFRKPISAVSPRALEALQQHPWPGNVRELRNAVERAVLLAEGDTLEAADFPVHPARTEISDAFDLPPAGIKLDELERHLVVQALTRTGGNRTQAAALLGLNRDQIRYRIEKFELDGTF
ncbi:MAG TPA: sigma-54 dependent transcriptional regulator [Vicinamibacterales bacterium]|nr:sigma-54 dependent transcriptional regulator [Vicinamibacterales bacterium]